MFGKINNFMFFFTINFGTENLESQSKAQKTWILT